MHWRSAILAASIFLPLTAMADVTYSYTGKALNDNLSGYAQTSTSEVTFDFTVSSPLAASTLYGWSFDPGTTAGYDAYTAIDAKTWSISDGSVQDSGTDTSASSQGDLINFVIETDSSRAIEYWLIEANWSSPNDTYADIETAKTPVGGIQDYTNSSGGVGIVYQSGTWSTGSAAATPEPCSMMLLGSGVAALAAMRRKRAASKASN